MEVHHRIWAISVLLVATLSLGAIGPALAQHEPPRLGLTPIGVDGQFFDLRLNPGHSMKLQVELASFGQDAVRARTYAADAYSLINGGFGAKLFGEPPSGATRWLHYSAREVTLAAHHAVVIDFSVTVSAGTPPGDYIAAVVAENAEPYRGDAGPVTLDQVDRVALAVAIDVPGLRAPALEIGAVGHKAAAGTSFITFEVANSGNVHLKPLGEFTLRDAARKELVRAPAVMDSVYAGSKTLFEAPLAKPLTPGDYCAELSLKDLETGASDATRCLLFTVKPPPASAHVEKQTSRVPILQPAVDRIAQHPFPAALIAAAMLVIVWLLWRRRRRRCRD